MIFFRNADVLTNPELMEVTMNKLIRLCLALGLGGLFLVMAVFLSSSGVDPGPNAPCNQYNLTLYAVEYSSIKGHNLVHMDTDTDAWDNTLKFSEQYGIYSMGRDQIDDGGGYDDISLSSAENARKLYCGKSIWDWFW